jgi:hypothetical protein
VRGVAPDHEQTHAASEASSLEILPAKPPGHRIEAMRVLCGMVVLLLACGEALPPAAPMPPGKTFVGSWSTNLGRLHLREYPGGVIRGNFTGPRPGWLKGKVELVGKVEGNLLTFTWRQADGQWGRAYLQMAPNGTSLEGRWGYQKDYTNGGRWWASRSGDVEEASPE